MNRFSKSPIIIVICGTLVAALLIGAGLLFMNPPQCPDYYTQAQVDATNCNVGANIGLPFVFILALGIFVAAFTIAVGSAISRSNKKTS